MTRGGAWLLAGVVLLAAAFIGFERASVAARPALPVLYTLGGEFELDSTSGDRLALSDLAGSIVLLNFGYTGCPDVCPTTLAKMREVMSLLGHSRSEVRPVFVTLDPEADALDRIGPYLNFFDPAFIGLTGRPEEVAAAAAAFKVYYERQPFESGSGYSISHSSHIYLIDSAGRVRATFGEGVPVGSIAEAVHRLMEASVESAGGDVKGEVWREV